MTKLATFALAAAVLAAATPALAGEGCGGKDLVTTARNDGQFGTLLAAAEKAGLVEVLRADGPYTLFAPTDAAFARIPKAQLDALLADRDKLAAVLKNHLVQGKVTSAEVAKLDRATTVQGSALAIDASDGVRVGDARVTQADVEASNGVIHVIDTVLLPPS